MELKYYLNTIVGLIGGLFVVLFGGSSKVLEILIYMMVLDYVTGVICALYSKTLSSKVGFRGLFKKIFILVICAVAFQVDNLLNANGIIQNASIVFYISNEAISILENGAKMGLPIPEKLRNAIAALKEEDE